jgi:hypothetical protein
MGAGRKATDMTLFFKKIIGKKMLAGALIVLIFGISLGSLIPTTVHAVIVGGGVAPGFGQTSPPSPGGAAATPGSTAATKAAGGSEGMDCGVGSYLGLGSGSLDGCFAWLMYEIMTMFAWLLGAIGLLFESTIYYTVLRLGTLINGDGSGNGLTAIGTAWGILRSLANIALLFTFVLIGIATILDIEEYGVKRLLPKLLIAAILLNFSLFVTKALIDVGDTFAVQIYKEISGGQVPDSFKIENEPISSALMDAIGIQKFYTDAANGE